MSVEALGDRELVVGRAFDAPRREVFEAWTRPELLKRWLGIRGGWTLPVCEVDLRVGGAYRYVWRNADGLEMGMRGEFREIEAPERIVCTESFDDPWYPGISVNTHVWAERKGGTRSTLTIRYESEEARDAVLESPMRHGLADSYALLDELLRES